MDEIKIFIVEDEDDQIELYKDAIEEFNEESGTVKITPLIAKTKDEAIEGLRNNFFDAVFIDLNLSVESHGSDTPEGNDLVDSIQATMRYPVFVVTGKSNEHIVELDNDNIFIELHLKDEDDLTNNLLKRVKKIYDTGITKVLGARGHLNDYLHSIFWEHLSKTMEYWLSAECKNCDIEKAISRYTLTHLYEYMEEASGTERITYDPAEMYIYPRIKTSIRPGDIVDKDGSKYLVLTPACTISQQCENFQLIKIVSLDLNQSINDSKEKIETNTKKIEDHTNIASADQKSNHEEELAKLIKAKENKINTFNSLIQSFVTNKKGERYHFLPRFLELEESLVDFQDITTVSKEDISEYHGKMTVSIYFFKDIQSRFSAFYARQGSPDFDKKKLSQEIMEKILAV
ncbi:MAG TPA: response regulator [Lutibacter sp.]|nr:response regulator [Arcobacter sp.]HIP49217.1 response regulator [Lutibacter sp.]